MTVVAAADDADRWAVLDAGRVVNVILWDGDTDSYDPGTDVVRLAADSLVGPGWVYDGRRFTPPPP